MPLWSNPIFAILGVVFFGYSVFLFGQSLFSNKVLMTLDSDGISIPGIMIHYGHIPWSEIQRTQIVTIPFGLQRQRYLVICVTNEARIYQAVPHWQHWLLKANKNFLPSPVYITELHSPVPLEELQTEIEDRLYARQKRLISARNSDVSTEESNSQYLSAGNR